MLLNSLKRARALTMLRNCKYAAAEKHKPESPSLAVDAMVLRKHRADKFHDILLIKRKNDPFKGKFAFPGGFVDYDEDPKDACLRELEEECGLIGKNPQLVDVKGNPARDPRKHIVAICYRVDVDYGAEVKAGSDAAEAQFYSLCKVLKEPFALAFDHFETLNEYINKTFPWYSGCVLSP